MGFGSDSISVITAGLIRATGSFAERLVSSGYIGDILTSPGSILILHGGRYLLLDLHL